MGGGVGHATPFTYSLKVHFSVTLRWRNGISVVIHLAKPAILNRSGFRCLPSPLLVGYRLEAVYSGRGEANLAAVLTDFVADGIPLMEDLPAGI